MMFRQSGTSVNVATTGSSQNISDKTFTSNNEFVDDGLVIQNPANSFNYLIQASAILSAETLTLPLTDGDDTFAVLALAQTFSNKTFSDSVQILETAGVVAVAGEGIFWTRSDIPTSAMFTDDTDVDYRINPRPAIEFIIDGGGAVIEGGIKGDLEIPNNFEVEEVTMLADQSGSITVDIWMEQLSLFPPTDADSITASAVPTITTDDNSQDTSLTGWTTSLVGRETLRYNVDGTPTSIQRVTVSLWGRWT